MICKFKKTLNDYHMIEDGDTVVVGLSGGADSVTLLHLLNLVKDEYNINLIAVHVNHCLRGSEADNDMKFAEDYCKTLGVEFRPFIVDVSKEAEKTGESFEECGRRIRYEIFNKVCDNAKIATAHTLSDNIETVIMNFVRGTGISGLCGIPPVRDNIVRPVINFSREEIEQYCKDNNLNYVTDSTNKCDEYKRNYIRHNIIPNLYRLNPSFNSAFSNCISLLKDDKNYLYNEVNRLIQDSKIDDTKYDVSVLLDSDISIRSKALSEIIFNFCGTYPEKKHVEILEELLQSSGKAQITAGIFAFVKRKVLYFEKALNESDEFCIAISGEGEYKLPKGKVVIKSCTHKVYNDLLYNSVSCDKICSNLIIRSRKAGDKITLQKRNVTKTLKKLFCEDNIPESKRGEIPVIADGENIVWVYGYGTDKKYIQNDEDVKKYIIEFLEEKQC